jgi:hypothetical protein
MTLKPQPDKKIIKGIFKRTEAFIILSRRTDN